MLRRSLWFIVSVTVVVVGALLVRHLSSLLGAERRRAAVERLRPRATPRAQRAPVESPRTQAAAAPTHTDQIVAGPSSDPGSGEAQATGTMLRPMLGPMDSTPGVPPAVAAVASVGRSAIAGERELPPEPARPLPTGRRSGVVLATIAAVAGVLAIALGSWAFVLVARSDDSNSTSELIEQAVALLADPSSQRIQFDGSQKGLTIVVGQDGEAVLVITGLKAQPAGKSYQAWVIGESGKPVPAVVFSGDARVVPLERSVPRGATVAITVEPEGGSRKPSHAPTIVAQRS